MSTQLSLPIFPAQTFTSLSKLFRTIADRINSDCATEQQFRLLSFEDLFGATVTVIPHEKKPHLPELYPCMKKVSGITHEIIAPENQDTDDEDPTCERIILLLDKHPTENYAMKVEFIRSRDKLLKLHVFCYRKEREDFPVEYGLLDSILARVSIMNTEFMTTTDE